MILIYRERKLPILKYKILVHTKYGIRPIIITKIQWLDKCPVDFSVKKVFKKIKK